MAMRIHCAKLLLVPLMLGPLALGSCRKRPPDPKGLPVPPVSRRAPSKPPTPMDEASGANAPDPPPLRLTPEHPQHFPVPQADYGAIAPSRGAPDPDTLTVHGLAGYEVVTVYDTPDVESASLGYLRVGARTMVSAAKPGKGCSGSWHELPQGGFACEGRGLVVDTRRAPRLHTPATAPNRDDTLPYRYAFVTRWNAPMYWRPPTAAEREIAQTVRATLESARNAPEPKTKPETSPTASERAPAPKPEASTELDTAPTPEQLLPLNPRTPWLERGFFLAVGETVEAENQRYWKTARGGFVDASAAVKYATKDFVGAQLPLLATFPFGFVMSSKGATRYELDQSGMMRPAGKLEHRTFVDLEEQLQLHGHTYMRTSQGDYVRTAVVRLAEPQPLPDGLKPWDRWIDVSLSKQMLVAYEGVRPVYATLVSTGKRGTTKESFETPTGRWRIRSKHVSTTMDGQSDSDGNYSIQDVPYTMYFHQSYALHGAFWHDGFGRVRSHGCINLGPSDAKWLFEWSTPTLPDGWHGVHAHADSPGTTIIVRQ